jgi:hypothetical protein
LERSDDGSETRRSPQFDLSERQVTRVIQKF